MARRLVALLLIALLVALGIQRWQLHRATRAREQAEFDAGLAAARVLSARFQASGQLRVARLTGEVLSVGDCTSGFVFDDRQRTVAPYRVDYTVDLAGLDRRGFRWDAKGRTILVDLPGVIVEAPAVDLSRARSRQSGLFVSRACGLAMQGQVAGRLSAAAAERARRADYVAAARTSARARVGQLVRATLAAAGLDDVTVRVRLATDPRSSDEEWDRSRSIAEVLADPK